jgi:putative membrane protein
VQPVLTLGLLILLAAGVTFCVQNVENVTLTFLTWTVVAPVWLVAVAGYLLGMLTGWGVAGVARQSWRRLTTSQPQ